MKLAVVHRSLEGLDALEQALCKDGEHECLWVAVDGRGLAARCRAQPPDLLLVDLAIKSPGPVQITRAVLETNTCGVVLVGDGPSSGTNAAYEAMAAGALDVLPILGEDGIPRDASTLSARISRLGRTLTPNGTPRVATPNGLPRPERTMSLPRVQAGKTPSRRAPAAAARNVRRPKLVAIGASTGGPQAIHQLLASLPRPVTCSIVIVQHIEGIFASGMTEWLSEGTGVRVKLAIRGAELEPGTALVAGSDGHLVLTPSGTFTYADEPKDAIHRPSVDAFFQSLAAHWPTPGIAVLLTGMGRDGAAGLHALRKNRWHTIAQDEATSVVFGMPKAAIQLGAAERTLPIGDVGPTIGRWLAG
jgi:two-component system, chemotaxis family, response regulator WspF